MVAKKVPASVDIKSNLQKRFLLFLIGCIPARFGLAFLAYKLGKSDYLPFLGYLGLCIALGFLYIVVTKSRNTVGAFGGPVWWQEFRPIHSAFYFLFAYEAIKRKPDAYRWIMFDTIIGILVFLHFHYIQGDFKKIF